jgi:hypothetical protein
VSTDTIAQLRAELADARVAVNSARGELAQHAAAASDARALLVREQEARRAADAAAAALAESTLARLRAELADARAGADAARGESAQHATEASDTRALLEHEHETRLAAEATVASLQARRPQPAPTSSSERLRRAFDSYDTNRDGSLDAPELMQLFDSLGYAFDTAELGKVLRVYDANADGSISFEEFQQMFLALP